MAQFKWDRKIIFLSPLTSIHNFSEIRSHGGPPEGEGLRHSICMTQEEGYILSGKIIFKKQSVCILLSTFFLTFLKNLTVAVKHNMSTLLCSFLWKLIICFTFRKYGQYIYQIYVFVVTKC